MHTLYLRPWSEISNIIQDKNQEVCALLSEISSTLKNCYVYELELPFGTDLITNGKPLVFDKTFISNCEFLKSESTQFKPEQFLNDFSNKNDHPLSLISSGIVEIYETNTYTFSTSQITYNFPLNIIREGELLGTFGATDLIHNSSLGKFHYPYSALCGHYCVYPLLPKSANSGKRQYRQKIREICKKYKVDLQIDEALFSFFPRLLKRLYSEIDKKVKLIFIPDFWYNVRNITNYKLREIIGKIAWLQSEDFRRNELSAVSQIKEVGGKASSIDYLSAEMIVYLKGIAEGKRLALKTVNNSSSIHSLYEILKNDLSEIYDPIMFNYDFLIKGEWGLFPLFTFPTLNPIMAINSANKFLETFKKDIKSTLPNLPDCCNLRYYENPQIYLKEHFPGRKVCKPLITRGIVKIELH